MKSLAAILLAVLSCTGCYRTVYSHITPEPAPGTTATTQSTRKTNNGWQNFFLYGWVPSERTIDAAAMCGGARHVESIRTQRTFVEGLVASFAGFYINIYSPWDGKVVCEGSEPATSHRARGHRAR